MGSGKGGGLHTHIATTDGKARWEEEEDGCHDYICDTELLQRCQRSAWAFKVNVFRQTKLQNQPSGPGRLNGLRGSILRPRRQFMAGGIAYEMPRATTDAEMMALKALVPLI